MQVLFNLLIKAGLIVEGSADFQGVSTAITQIETDSSKKIATTEFVALKISSTSINQLSDVSALNPNYGDVLMYDGAWYAVGRFVRSEYPVINSVPYFTSVGGGEQTIDGTVMTYDGSGFLVSGPDDDLAFRSIAGGNGIGLQGESQSLYGVYGISSTGVGVLGKSTSGPGLRAISTSGIIQDWYSGINEVARVSTEGGFLIGKLIYDGYRLDVNGSGRFNNFLTVEKNTTTNNTSLFKIKSGTNGAGNIFDIQYYKDAALVNIGYYGNTGNRVVINGGFENLAPSIQLFEQIGTEAPVSNVKINSNSVSSEFDGYTYFYKGNFLIGTKSNSVYKLDVVGADARINTVKIGLGGGQVEGNISIGRTSIGELSGNSSGNYLFAFGDKILRYNTTGRANVGIGNESLGLNTTGSFNTASSVQALYRNISGDYNLAMGAFAALFNTTGSFNVNLGSYAGVDYAGGTGINGDYNIFLGPKNYAGITSGSYNVIIGGQITGSTPNLSNNIIIADGQGNIRFRDTGTATVLTRLAGTGTRMVVAGVNGELSTQAISSGSGTVSSVGFSITSNVGDVSYTLTNPTTTPAIVLNIPTASSTSRGVLSTTDYIAFSAKQNAITNPVTGTGTINYMPKWTSSSAIGNSLIFDNGTNIGIGTATPGEKLDVNGNIRGSYIIATSTLYGSQLRVDGIYPNSLTYVPFYSNVTPFGEIMRINNNGSVLIGATVPDGYKLQVAGNVSITGDTVYMNNNTGSSFNFQMITTTGSAAIESGNGNLSFRSGGLYTQNMLLSSSGNLGIGTTSPIFRLDVNGTSRFNDTLLINKTTDAIFRLRGGTYSGQYDTTLRAMSGAQGILQLGNNDINYIIAGNNTTGGYLSFRVNATGENVTSGTEAMRITAAGNLLIGSTQSTGSKLYVNGGVSIGSYQTYDSNYSLHVFGSTKVESALDVIGHIVSNSYIETGNYSTQTGGQLRVWSGTSVPMDIHTNPSILYTGTLSSASHFLPINVNGSLYYMELFSPP